MALGKSIRHGDHNTEQRGSTIPDGIYELEVEAADVKKSAKGGTYLALTYEVFAPESHKGRKFWQNINLTVPSSRKAEEIGEEELSKLIRVTGWPEEDEFTDEQELRGHPFLARVYTKEEDGQPKNVIGRLYYPDEEQPQPALAPKKEERERPGSRREEPSRERSREPERSRKEEPSRERSREPSRDREPERSGRDDSRDNRGRDDDRDELDRAADEGSREVEGRNAGGDERPWKRGERR